MSTRAYPVEIVECPKCDGLGEDIYAPDDPLDWHGNRCVDCFGSGTVEVCANCLDELYEGCSECSPTVAVPPSSLAAPEEGERT